MIVDGDAAGRVLSDDLERPAQPFVDDGTRKGYNTVLNLDADARAGAQSSLFSSARIAALISASEWGTLVEGAGDQQAFQKIGTRDDSDQRLPPQNRQSLDAVSDHPVDRFAELRILSLSSAHRASSLHRPSAPCSWA